MHLRTQDAEIGRSATEACVTGETFGGQPIAGCDGIRIVPPVEHVDGPGAAPAVLLAQWLTPAFALGTMAAAGFRGLSRRDRR